MAPESQNYGITEIGKALQDHQGQALIKHYQSHHCLMFPSVTLTQLLNPSSDGDFTTALGSSSAQQHFWWRNFL